MTPIFSMVLTIAVVIAVSLIIVILYHLRRQKKTERLLSGFENAAAEFNLSIAKQQLLGNRVIGYDNANNKLLFLVRTGNKEDGYLVDLEDVKSCTVNKSYGPTKKSRKKPGAYIKMIALQLNYKNGAKPLLLPFYIKTIDPVSEIMEKAKQAKEWQTLLSASMTKKSNRMGKSKKFGQEHIPLYGERNLLDTNTNVFSLMFP